MERNTENKGKILSIFRKILEFLIISLFFSAGVYLLLIDVFPPRIFLSPFYITSIVLVTGLTLFTLNIIFSKLCLKIKKSKLFQSIQQWSFRKKTSYALLVLAVVASLIAIKPILESVNDINILEKARLQFTPIPYGVISQNKIDRTLIELEKTLSDLREKYIETTPEYLIKVYLFSNRNELIQQTGISEWAAGGISIQVGQIPILAIPVETEKSFWNNSMSTSTPAHEITHLVSFEAIRLKDINIIPLFFLEGMAEYESMNNFNRFPDRIWNRFGLFLYRNQVSKIEQIPNINIKDKNVSNEDISLFYRLSDEFVRYLVKIYGEDKPWDVLKIVGEDMNFHDSFMMVFNKEYTVVYTDFLKYFY